MCRQVQIFHGSCQTVGLSKIFRCAELKPRPNGIFTLRTQTAEEYPMPDFCANCFLSGGLFEDQIGEDQRKEILRCPIYKRNSNLKCLQFSEKVFQRAESDPSNTGKMEEHFVLPRYGSSRSTRALLIIFLQRLKVWFWHQVLEKRESPSFFRRLLIVQLQSYQVSNYFQQLDDVYNLRAVSADIRMDLILEKVGLPDVGEVSAEDSNCIICREDFGATNEDGHFETPMMTACNHLFGDNCLLTWVCDHETCPFCRQLLLSFDDSDRLYFLKVHEIRASTGIPQWLIDLTGYGGEELLEIGAQKINLQELYLNVVAHIKAKDYETDPDAVAYMHFGFLE